MASLNTVTVTDIASTTSDQEVQEFFAFCGKIDDLKFKPDGDKKSATVVFNQATAAKTALMLNNTQLGPNQIHVQDASGGATEKHVDAPPATDRATDELTQEEKPRTRIFAEYLAHGYVIGDVALERAIDLDHKHNVTKRFVTTLTNLDNKYQAVDRAKTADQSYHISQRATNLLTGLGSYFEKASTTPTGRKLVNFYSEGSRQVQDIHAEARRLADIKKQQHGGNAYQASGLERIFGKEKPAEPTVPAAAPAAEGSASAAPAGEAVPAAAPGIAAPATGAPPAA